MAKRRRKRRMAGAEPRNTEYDMTNRPDKDLDDVRTLIYEVTDEPILDPEIRRLPRRIRERLSTLFELSQTEPLQAIPELEALIEKYPHIPVYYNYLGAAYNAAGQREKARQLIMENYEKNPDYLFARVNYATICLEDGEPEKIPEIFDNKLDLKLLYPERNVFHITEAVNFMGTIGLYYVEIGEKESAKILYAFLKDVGPKHPLTRLLKGQLYPNIIRRLLSGKR